MLEGLGRLALGMNVLQYAGKAHALAIDELALAAAEQPAGLQAVGLRDTELDPVVAVALGAHGMLHGVVDHGQVFGVDAGKEHVQGHLGAGGQPEQGLAAVVPQQQTFLWAQVPGAHAGGVDGDAGARFHICQRFFGATPALAFLHFGQRPAHGLGQQWQVFLQYIIGGTQADHLHCVLFAVDTGKEDERGVRRQALGNGQHVGTGRAGQHAVAKDQVVVSLTQGVFDTDMVEHQVRLDVQPTALQAQQGQLGVHRAVFDHQQFQRRWQHLCGGLNCCCGGSGAASRVAVR
ncbi:hypothetical protein D3C81_1084290 [compost metagenome]